MGKKNNFLPNFIIAGTVKAGTSSLFTNLVAHPRVCGSIVKETGFFVNHFAGIKNRDLETYSEFFRKCSGDFDIVMEGSPGYLGYSSVVCRRIKEMLPEVKLLFILRDPIERVYSYYNFHIGQLTPDFDIEISFEDYIEKCALYSSGVAKWKEFKFDERHLRALEIGRYVIYLRDFYDTFSEEQIKVLFFDDLIRDTKWFTSELCKFLNIDFEFFNDHSFVRSNVTSTSRNKILHRLALRVNKRLETFLRQRPFVKNRIVILYNMINQKSVGYPAMNEKVKLKLSDYYAKSNLDLKSVLDRHDCPMWLN